MQIAVPLTQSDSLEFPVPHCRKGCAHSEGARRKSNPQCMHRIEDVSWQNLASALLNNVNESTRLSFNIMHYNSVFFA